MLLTIGISGKRFIAHQDRDRLIAELKACIDSLLKENGSHEFTGLSSLAIGADSIFAELVLNHYHQPLEAILPFPAEEYRKDFSEGEQLDFDRYLSAASEVRSISLLPMDNEQRETAYLQAGKYISKHSKELLIVFTAMLRFLFSFLVIWEITS